MFLHPSSTLQSLPPGSPANLCSKSYRPTFAVLSCTPHVEIVMPEGFIKTCLSAHFEEANAQFSEVVPPKSFPQRWGMLKWPAER